MDIIYFSLLCDAEQETVTAAWTFTPSCEPPSGSSSAPPEARVLGAEASVGEEGGGGRGVTQVIRLMLATFEWSCEVM